MLKIEQRENKIEKKIKEGKEMKRN